MRKIWLISDTHFGHTNLITFKDSEGKRFRPFESIAAHDKLIKDNWKRFIKPTDIVYHLGDVVMNKKHIEQLYGLPGHKRLILGNHDSYEFLKLYQEHFKKIMACRDITIDGVRVLLSHIPVKMEESRWDLNIHGHIHEKPNVSDRHVNVCLEKTDWCPILLTDVVKGWKFEQGI